ncbi:MAG: hypothetical protein ABI317_17085, partial [Gaiellales bacterium]
MSARARDAPTVLLRPGQFRARDDATSRTSGDHCGGSLVVDAGVVECLRRVVEAGMGSLATVHE